MSPGPPPVSGTHRRNEDRFAAPASVLVVLGGPGAPSRERFVRAVGPQSVVIAADSGLDAALDARIVVPHVVGALASVTPTAVTRAERSGAAVHRHPRDKDATDGELALDLAVEILGDLTDTGEGEPRHLVVVGGGGGRLDHLLGDVLGLVRERLAPFDVTAHLGPATITIVRAGRARSLHGRAGELVSLLAVSEPARGVTTEGLRWPLREGDLAPGSTRGASNEMEADEARVSLLQGTLVAIAPGQPARDVEPRASRYDPSPRLHDGFGGPEDHRPQ